MFFLRTVFAVSFTWLLAGSYAEHNSQQIHRANHVFNAIHSSVRQWGSSLNHNGMSLFLASVPAGMRLYHGTPKEDIVKGIEWLAFEPEHALIFAQARRPHGPGTQEASESHVDYFPVQDERSEPFWQPGQPAGKADSRSRFGNNIVDRRTSKAKDNQIGESKQARRTAAYAVRPPQHPDDSSSHSAPPDFDKRPRTPVRGSRNARYISNDSPNGQHPLIHHRIEQDDNFGYLHTYVPKHDLRLLYVDGLSAGKSDIGTLDVQDFLLLNRSSSGLRGPTGGEPERASGLCELASTLWKNKIDGILRMEGGFEIILCDFEAHLERKDVMGTAPKRFDRGFLGGWQYLEAVTSRYHGIGGGRVKVDYNRFVSIFAYPGLKDLFHNHVESDYPMPRIQNISKSDLAMVQEDVNAMIMQKDWNQHEDGRDWQAVTDVVVKRYSAILHFLHTNDKLRQDSVVLTEYLQPILRPYIDDRRRNTTRELERCVAQHVPELQVDAILAHRTIHAITHRICDTLLTAFSIASTPASHSVGSSARARPAIELVDELVEYLQWTSWKECGSCEDAEICYIPIWPMGTIEDHANPRCRNKSSASNRFGYWGSLVHRSTTLSPLSSEHTSDQSTLLNS